MMYKVFRQGSYENPKHCPQLDEPWVWVGTCEADSRDEAIRKMCGDEPPIYNKVWYIALDKGTPGYYKVGDKVYGKPQIRPW